MAKKSRSICLNLYINGTWVGVVTRHRTGAVEFIYAADWLESPNRYPISYSLPLNKEPFYGAEVVNFFDNLLPDAEVIRRKIATRIAAQGSDALSILAKIGNDCVGCLQFFEEGITPQFSDKMDYSPLTDQAIAKTLTSLTEIPLGNRVEDEFRISIAGAQEKTALLKWQGQWAKPIGTTPTNYILKPQIGIVDRQYDWSLSVENEYLCMKLCKAFGLPTAEVSIENFDGVRALAIERFDRLVTKDNRLIRLPQEDFCQAFSVPSNLKYESDGGPGIVKILSLLVSSDAPIIDQNNFIKAQMVFWLLGATDGHAKNFSRRMIKGDDFRMTKIYDVLSSQPLLDSKSITFSQFKLAMAVGNNRHREINSLAPRYFIETAAKAGMSEKLIKSHLSELFEGCDSAISDATASLQNDYPMKLAESIIAGVKSRAPLLVQ